MRLRSSSALRVDPLTELAPGHLQRHEPPLERLDGNVSLPAFDGADVVPVQSRTLAKSFLGKPLRFACISQNGAYRSDARWEQNVVDGSLIPEGREGIGWMLVDRVDAVTEILDAISPPRANSLLHGARILLGHVLRDVTSLRAALESVPAARGDVRRRLVLALALLGEGVHHDEALPHSGDELDTAAYILSLVLSDPDRDRVSRALRDVLARAASSEARRTASEADRYVSSGLLLSVIG
jgi:hypothetical protein